MQRSQALTLVAATAGVWLQGACNHDTSANRHRDAVTGAFPKPITQHGEKWQDPEASGTKGKGWREPILYVDGVPRSAFRGAEFPIDLEPMMIEKHRALDYNASDPGPRTAIYYTPRWNVADYLTHVGVPLNKIKLVVFHGGRGVAYVKGDDFRLHRKGFFFDLTDETKGFLRVYTAPGYRFNTTYDRYVGISVFVDKPAPVIDQDDQLTLDGEPVEGVPYYGQPLRGGIRVYVDDQIATVIKRNLLGNVPQGKPGLAATLAAFGINTDAIVTADVVVGVERTQRMSGDELRAAWFTSAEQASGSLLLNGNMPVSTLMLYTKKKAGKLPTIAELSARGMQRGAR